MMADSSLDQHDSLVYFRRIEIIAVIVVDEWHIECFVYLVDLADNKNPDGYHY